MVTFHGLEKIKISTSVKNKEEYYEICKKASERIISEFNNQLPPFNGGVVFSLAIPHNFFTTTIDSGEQDEICNAINKLSSDLKSWIV